MKKTIFNLSLVLLFSLSFFACSEESSSAPEEVPALGKITFEGWNVESKDSENFKIKISPKDEFSDSITIKSVESLANANLYFAADDDLYDPQLGEKLEKGSSIYIADTNSFSIVVLDEVNRVVCVWLVSWDKPEEENVSSSSEAGPTEKPVSSAEVEESSSSEQPVSSSSENKNEMISSSSTEKIESSSSLIESSSAALSSSSQEIVVSSSSIELSSSSVSKNILLSELSVNNGTVSVEENRVYIEVPYGSDISNLQLNPLDTANDFRRPVEMEFEDSEGNVNTYSVIAGMQLPGTTFDSRESSFWATTSDAMATSATGASIKVSSEANLSFSASKATITTKELTGSFIGISGSWKMAGGFYFSGSYSATDALHIYHQGWTSGTPSTDESDISADMTFGKSFTARPTAFELSYSYTHVDNENSDYPQKSLVYVILVSADKKAVALGMISNNSSVSATTKTVTLSYGSDPNGILTAGYAGTSDLTLGNGTEDVASIRVMFASSAYAHVVAGGALGSEDKYRGGENSSLVLDNFKLIY